MKYQFWTPDKLTIEQATKEFLKIMNEMVIDGEEMLFTENDIEMIKKRVG